MSWCTRRLQMQVFGDITARIPQAQLSSMVARYALTRDPVTLKAGGTIPLGYVIRPSDGLATLSLRAEWDEDVSANLDIEIVQNGDLLHRLDWKEQREYWAYSDTRLGGYPDGRRYKALALAPLARRVGANEVVVRVAHASKPVRITTDSEVQVWPRRSVKLPGATDAPIAAQAALDLLRLGHGAYAQGAGGDRERAVRSFRYVRRHARAV